MDELLICLDLSFLRTQLRSLSNNVVCVSVCVCLMMMIETLDTREGRRRHHMVEPRLTKDLFDQTAFQIELERRRARITRFSPSSLL